MPKFLEDLMDQYNQKIILLTEWLEKEHNIPVHLSLKKWNDLTGVNLPIKNIEPEVKKESINSMKTKLSLMDDSELAIIQEFLNEQLEAFNHKKDKDILKEWILNEWDDCNHVRMKIDNEGTGYFYNCYVGVPVPWDIYIEFYESGEECWCGKNCIIEW